ncbi:MAG: hypothetical protein KKA79_02550 [Nanoarchaeota archaeon]|nr:hypothetical protein [Nanoarchaeota archaeon]MCG2718919.1 hypothetical protein [Nanoarchaeota archaeon]
MKKLLKKTIKPLKRSLHLLMLINIVCTVTSFALVYFTGKKIQQYVTAIYSYLPQIQEWQQTLAGGANLSDLDSINEVLAVINHSNTLIAIVTAISLVAFFLIICFFQSLEWNIAFKSLKKKIKMEDIFVGYLKYAIKFSIITIPIFIILLSSMFYLFNQVKEVFNNIVMKMYGLEGIIANPNYVLISILLIIMIFVSYYAAIVYVMLNKYKLKQAVQKSFSIAKNKLKTIMPLHLLLIILIVPIVYIDSILVQYIDFKISVIASLLIYFFFVAYYQVLLTVMLEKE